MWILFPHFFLSILVWALNAEVPKMNPTWASKEFYLTIIGISKYLPSLLLAGFAGFWIARQSSRKFLTILGVACGVISFILGLVADPSVAGLMVMMLATVFQIFYEPFIELICQDHGKSSGNFVEMNALIHLMHTTARFVAPILVLGFLSVFTGFSLAFIAAVFFWAFAGLAWCLAKENSEPSSDGVVAVHAKIGFADSLKAIFRNQIALGLFAVYGSFYLSVNYLEYIAMLGPKVSGFEVNYLYSILGLGFMAGNLVSLRFRHLLQSKPQLLVLCLWLTAASLAALPVAGSWVFIPLFFVGLGNGVAVPLSIALAQRALDRKILAHFSGVLSVVTTACGLMSMGIGLLTYRLWGLAGLFCVDALFVAAAGVAAFLITRIEVKHEK